MGLFSTLGSYFGPVGTLVGGLVDSSQSSGRSSDLSGEVRGMSEEQYQRSLPWDATGQFGGITYDREGKAVSTELSAPWQTQMDSLLGRSSLTNEQISKYSSDPVAMGMEMAAKKRDLRQPGRNREALSQEARLLSQGKLFTTGGQGQQQMTRDSWGTTDLQDEQASYLDALKLGTTMRDWQKGDIKQAISIGDLPMNYLDLAQSGGISNDPYAKSKVEGAKGASKAKGMMYDEFGNVISGMLGGSSVGGLSYDDPYIQDIGISSYT